MPNQSWRQLQQTGPSDAGEPALALDLRFLADATKLLNGYFVYRWFNDYLGLLFDNLARYIEIGIVTDLGEPTDDGRYSMLFDFSAIDLDSLAYINGVYFYVLASHKTANRALMNPGDRKHVLYLRGYDYELSVAESGAAVGAYSLNTTSFTMTLSDLLDPRENHVQVFKVMSSLDLWAETIDAQNYFYGNYGEVVRLAHRRIRGLYMNALRWQQDLLHLLDRMDHYVVYVSSITESALWELDQLDQDGRRERVTIVFDIEAIANKESQLDLRDAMQRDWGEKVIWRKKGSTPEQTVDDLRAHLSQRFTLTTPEEFERDVEIHRRRIAESAASLAPGARETWIEFRFEPATGDAELDQLREFSAYLEAEITSWTDDRGIDCLPLFLNLVQLRVFATLLMGEHHETGVALARYAAVMKQSHEYYSAPGRKPGALSKKGKKPSLDTLLQHLDLAEGLAWVMLSFGQSNEFGDYREHARTVYDAEVTRTKQAVDQFFRTVVERNAG
jgi:hypothetical protein